MKTLSIITIAIAFGFCSQSAFAHQNHIDKKKPVAAAAKEQKDWGIAGDAAKVTRTITVSMSDKMRFTPDKIEIKQGETVRIAITNAGTMLHEMVIGTKKELADHAAMMVKFPNMEHDEPYMAHVPAGKKGEIIWTFNKAGEFEFACLIAGHYSSGMVGKIMVAAK